MWLRGSRARAKGSGLQLRRILRRGSERSPPLPCPWGRPAEGALAQMKGPDRQAWRLIRMSRGCRGLRGALEWRRRALLLRRTGGKGPGLLRESRGPPKAAHGRWSGSRAPRSCGLAVCSSRGRPPAWTPAPACQPHRDVAPRGAACLRAGPNHAWRPRCARRARGRPAPRRALPEPAPSARLQRRQRP